MENLSWSTRNPVAMVVLAFVSRFVLPQFREIFRAFRVELPVNPILASSGMQLHIAPGVIAPEHPGKGALIGNDGAAAARSSG